MKTTRLFILCIVLAIAGVTGSIVDAQNTEAPVLKGAWEGVIEAPKRPLVLAADFSSSTAKLDATGSSPWTIQKLSNKGVEIRFEITVGTQAFQFEGQLRQKEIRGNVRVGEQVLTFWLEPLPVLPAPRDRVDAWQQDLDNVLTRFIRYDRSFSPEARKAFVDRIAVLRQSIATKSDQQIMVELS
ncbi:MAG TPA: hypothetical protein VLA93_11065, partial [Pyrinomonadaceae bacterium]|nr:hypothetical protein [Pyrinomonadaceae bacterium]